MPTLFHIDDIADDSSRGFEADGRSYFAVKKDGQLYIYENRCPHLGIELNWQEHQFLDVEAALIHCSTHGALFLPDTGECVSGPCQGEHLTAVAFDVDNGSVSLATTE